MKRLLFLLLAIVLWLPGQLRAQDVEALDALVGVLKEVDDPAFHLDILKGISAALKGQRNIKIPKGWKEIAPKLAKSPNAEVRQLGADAFAHLREQGGAGCFARRCWWMGRQSWRIGKKALAALVAARDPRLPEVLAGASSKRSAAPGGVARAGGV